MFTNIGCFEGTFPLQFNEGCKPYKAPPRHVAYELQLPFKEPDHLQRPQTIIPLGIDEMSKRVLQWLSTGPQAKWERMIMPRSSKVKESTNRSNTQGPDSK